MVIITDYKSGDFNLKVYHIESASLEIIYFAIELDTGNINEDTNYKLCTYSM